MLGLSLIYFLIKIQLQVHQGFFNPKEKILLKLSFIILHWEKQKEKPI